MVLAGYVFNRRMWARRSGESYGIERNRRGYHRSRFAGHSHWHTYVLWRALVVRQAPRRHKDREGDGTYLRADHFHVIALGCVQPAALLNQAIIRVNRQASRL